MPISRVSDYKPSGFNVLFDRNIRLEDATRALAAHFAVYMGLPIGYELVNGAENSYSRICQSEKSNGLEIRGPNHLDSVSEFIVSNEGIAPFHLRGFHEHLSGHNQR